VTSPRHSVLDVLDGKTPERVSFIIWDNKPPSPGIERRLLELGACIIVNRAGLDDGNFDLDPLFADPIKDD
jgi:hypothetical protein